MRLMDLVSKAFGSVTQEERDIYKLCEEKAQFYKNATSKNPTTLIDDFEDLLNNQSLTFLLQAPNTSKDNEAKKSTKDNISSFIAQSFSIIANKIETEDIKSLANLIADNDNFSVAHKRTKDSSIIAHNNILASITQMCKRTPTNEKIDLFKDLDRNNFLHDVLKTANNQNIARFIENAFDNIDQQEIIDTIINSQAVSAIPDRKNIREYFYDKNIDNKFIPVLDAIKQNNHQNNVRVEP